MFKTCFSIIACCGLLLFSTGCGGGGGDEPDEPKPTQPTPQPTPDPEKPEEPTPDPEKPEEPTPDPEKPAEPTPEPQKIPIAISAQIAGSSEGFENGTQIGVYAVNYSNGSPATLAASGNLLDNVAFKLSSGAWNASTQYYWSDESTKADFYCYSPYTPSPGSVTDFRFEVAPDQKETAKQNGSKFYWGKTGGVAPTSSPVALSLNQLMSFVKVTLIAGDGYTDADLNNAVIEIHSLKTAASVNLSSGAVQAVGDAKTISPYGTGAERMAVVVPQTITDAEMIVVTLDGNRYALKQSVTLEPGKTHSCSLTLKKEGQGMSMSLSGWDISDTDYGGDV